MFPENVKLRRKWHFAWADVQMTMQLIEFYFSQVTEDPEAAPVLPSFESGAEDDDWEPCDGKFTRLLDSKEPCDGRFTRLLDSKEDLALSAGGRND